MSNEDLKTDRGTENDLKIWIDALTEYVAEVAKWYCLNCLNHDGGLTAISIAAVLGEKRRARSSGGAVAGIDQPNDSSEFELQYQPHFARSN